MNQVPNKARRRQRFAQPCTVYMGESAIAVADQQSALNAQRRPGHTTSKLCSAFPTYIPHAPKGAEAK